MADTNDLAQAYMARSQSGSVADADAALEALSASYDKPGQVASATPAPVMPPKRTPGQVAGAVAKDVGEGVAMESPVQIVGGVADAFGNAAKGLAHVGDWLDSHVVNTYVGVPSSGNSYIDAIGGALLDPLAAAGKLSGAIPQAKSVTGGMIREASTFLMGFVPALRLAKGIGLGAAAGSVAAGAAAGATVLDPSAPNLSKTINDNVTVPASLKPVVDALATNPNDPEIINRARNLIENAGFGIATEGVLRGARALAGARRALAGEPAPVPKDELDAMRAEYGEATPRDFMILGDPDKPVVSVKGPSAQAEADSRAAARTNRGFENTQGYSQIPTNDGGAVYVNWAKVNEPEDVQKVMDRMATEFSKGIDVARRGVQSHEETAQLADELGMSVDDLLARRQGAPFNAEQALAARQLWGASAQKLMEVADKAASPNASMTDQYNFRKMMAVHYAVQQQVIAARTETARALNAWKIPANGGVEQMRAISQLLDQNGGSVVSTTLAKRIAALKNAGVNQDGINAAVRKGWAATTVDGVREAFVQGLLWSPSTHIVNTMSNSIVAAQQIYERAAASGISALRGGDDGVATGEAAAMAGAVTGALRDAFTVAGRALRTGERGGSMGSKLDVPDPNAISSDTVSREMGHNAAQAADFKDTGLGKFIDYAGFATNVPGRLLGAEDEFFKTIGYRMELHAQATRTIAAEGLTGEQAAMRYSDILTNPPENVRIAAADAALYNTFQSQPSDLVRAIMTAREKSGPVGWLLLPFLKTPANILAYTFERTPAAPITARFRADYAAGGARRDLALAKMATGTAIMMTALDLADSGLLTGSGPDDPAERASQQKTGWQANSIRMGDKWVSYNRTDPLAMPLAFAATVNEKFKHAAANPEDMDEWQELLGAGVATASETVVDKSWFAGFANLITAIQESRSEGSGRVAKFIGQEGAAMVPFSTALNTGKRFLDPVTRQAMNPYDQIIARTPIMSKTLPPARDVWGAALKPDEVYGRAYDVMSPLAVSEKKDSPIDAELTRLQGGLDRIGVRTNFQGVQVNFADYPHVYDRYVREAGNDLKHPAFDQGAKDFLDRMVSGKGPTSGIYGRLGDQGKLDMIKGTVSEFRQLAQSDIMRTAPGKASSEEKAFISYVQQKQAEERAARIPQ